MANTGLQITNVGLTAAAGAAPGGPYIHITKFKVGDAFNYIPDTNGDEVALHGAILYTGIPISFTVPEPNTLDIVLQMDSTVGTFSFGEIGVYVDDGLGGEILFASCAWDTLQEKTRAAGNQAGSLWRIHARLVLQQLPNIVVVEIINSTVILEVGSWTLLLPPDLQPTGANVAIVHESNFVEESVFVARDNDNNWALLDYIETMAANVSDGGASSTTGSITHPSISSLTMPTPLNARYVVKFSDGNIRNIVNHAGTLINFLPALAAPPTGAFTIWEDLNSRITRLASGLSGVDLSDYVTHLTGPLVENAITVGAAPGDIKPIPGGLGTSGQVLTSNGPGSPPSMQAIPSSPPSAPSGLGIGQSWVVFSGPPFPDNRFYGIAVTNETSSPILILVTIQIVVGEDVPTPSILYVNGSEVLAAGIVASGKLPIVAVIRPGDYYYVQVGSETSIVNWWELR